MFSPNWPGGVPEPCQSAIVAKMLAPIWISFPPPIAGGPHKAGPEEAACCESTSEFDSPDEDAPLLRGPIAVGRGKRLWRGVGRDRTAGGRNRLLRNVILGDAGWQRTVIDARRGAAAIDDHDVRRSAIVAGNGHRA